MKICTKCGQPGEFYKDKKAKDGLRSDCKKCNDDRRKKWCAINPQRNKESQRESHRRWYVINSPKVKESTKKYREIHPDKVKVAIKKWTISNPEKMKAQWNRDNAKKYSTVKGKLNKNMSRRINKFLHGSKVGRHWEDLVDYTIDQLKRHIEKLFNPEMTWDNYGTVWEIDHKIPIAVFNYEKPEHLDFKLCWNINNLRPLAKHENRSKSDMIEVPFQPSLAI